MDTATNSKITVIPTGAALAADVVGVDLSLPISNELYAQIRKAWNDHLVLRFRGQKLDDPQFLKFARLFGELDKAPIHAGKDVQNPFPEITVMSNIKVDGKAIGNLGHYEALWHSDMSYNEKCPIGSLLYSIEVPPVGGNTGFSNMYHAYDTLPADLKRAVTGKTCRHDSSRNSAGELRKGFKEVTDPREAPGANHPIIRTHPVTGRKNIYVNDSTTVKIVGISDSESEDILGELRARCIRPEFVYRHHWRLGDLLMWDNCSSQHQAVADYALPQRRRMHRTTITGTVPF